MTERLYLVDCYLRKFNASIIEITEQGIVLNQSAFYPEGGGQLGDRGRFTTKENELQVTVKNTIQTKGKIIHEVDLVNDLEAGMTVTGEIDWNHRLCMMRYHTAQHIISRYFQLQYGSETVSNQIKTDISRLDFTPLTKLSPEELSNITDKINLQIISQNMPVTITFLPREEAIIFLGEKEYQTKYLNMVPKSVQKFRIVAVDDYDWAACAGTHVRNTSEIGRVILERTVNKGKYRERVYYSLEP